MLVIGILTIIGCEPIKPHFLGMGFNAQTLKCGKYEVVFNFNSQCNPYISLWSQSEFGDWQYTSASVYEIVVFWLLRTTRNRKQQRPTTAAHSIRLQHLCKDSWRQCVPFQ